MIRLSAQLLAIAAALAPTLGRAETIRIGFEARFTNVDPEYSGEVVQGDTFRGQFSVVTDTISENGFLWGVSWEIHDVELTGDQWHMQQTALAGAFSVAEYGLPGDANSLLHLNNSHNLHVSVGSPLVIEPGPLPPSDASDDPINGFIFLYDAFGNVIVTLTDFGDLSVPNLAPVGLIVPFPSLTIEFEPVESFIRNTSNFPNLIDLWPNHIGAGAIGPQSYFDLLGHGPLAHFEVTSV